MIFKHTLRKCVEQPQFFELESTTEPAPVNKPKRLVCRFEPTKPVMDFIETHERLIAKHFS